LDTGDCMSLPGLRGLDHVGFTVPDIDAATSFFIDVVGCQLIYSLGSITDDGHGWMRQHLNVPAAAKVKDIRLLRCGHGSNFELFEFEFSDQQTAAPRNCDIGGHHLAFYVDDFDAALTYLRDCGLTVLGEPTVRVSGPSAGQTWVYFLSPWGMQLELVSFPDGKAYERTAQVKLWSAADPAA